MPLEKSLDFLAGLNGAAYKWNYSFLNGVTGSQISRGAPPMQKSFGTRSSKSTLFSRQRYRFRDFFSCFERPVGSFCKDFSSKGFFGTLVRRLFPSHSTHNYVANIFNIEEHFRRWFKYAQFKYRTSPEKLFAANKPTPRLGSLYLLGLRAERSVRCCSAIFGTVPSIWC